MLVPVCGDIKSKIMLVGEAPGREEEQCGVPFVGAAGRLLDEVLGEVGLGRDDCYITNVVQVRPPDNNFNKLPASVVAAGVTRLTQEIIASESNIIIALGEHSLRAITGIGEDEKITDWRGSILPVIINGEERKVIPTIHPAYVLRNWVPWRVVLRLDLARAKEESKTREYEKPVAVCSWPDRAYLALGAATRLLKADMLSVDIETNMQTHAITCVGFSDGSEGVSFGLYPYMYQDGEKGTAGAKEAIWALLNSSKPKVTQNGSFDINYLKRAGYPFNNWSFDTMYAQHLLNVEFPRSLAFLTSIHTRHPYYKGVVKKAVELDKMTWPKLAWYNCMDVICTWEIAQVLQAEIKARGLTEFYQEHYTDLLKPLMEAQLEGVRYNVAGREKVKAKLVEELKAVEKKVNDDYLPEGWMPLSEVKRREKIQQKIYDYELSGRDYTKAGHWSKNFLNWVTKLDNFKPHFNLASNDQVGDLLYRALKVPKRYRSKYKKYGSKRVTTDEEALTRIMQAAKTTQSVRELCKLILEYRSLAKLIGTYLECKLDRDERMRCSYKLAGTKTGRLASEKSITGTGGNLQNVPKGKGRGGIIRSLYLPDEGDVFVSADYSQAEARVVGYCAEEPGFTDRFENGYDLFSYVAHRVWTVFGNDITEERRALAKKLVHATNYGQGVEGFAFNANLSLNEAEYIYQSYQKKFPKLAQWREEIKMKLDKDRCLRNLLGRSRVFYDRIKNIYRDSHGFITEKWNKDILRDAFSYIPQSTVADLLNLALARLWEGVQTVEWEGHKPRFRLQVHDEMIWSVAPDDVEGFKSLIQQAMKIPLTAPSGEMFYIPANISVGNNWAEL